MQQIRTITRETDDTAKGFLLQKLRATSLMLSNFTAPSPIDFVAAVEYGGDIYLEDKAKIFQYVEENKAYASKDFSMASREVKNTLVYFLDHWLNQQKNSAIQFGFYATNKIVKEINSGVVADLNIILPIKPIIEQLRDKNYNDPHLIEAASKLIIEEYRSQYANNKKYPIAQSNYTTITGFSDQDWKSFFDIITWQFEQEGVEELETKIEQQIAAIQIPGHDLTGLEPYIRAQLVYELEAKHVKQATQDRFIDKQSIELILLRVKTNGIGPNSYRYLSLNYQQLSSNTKQQLQNFIQKKYASITGRQTLPVLLQRKVALFDPSLRIFASQTEGQPFEKEKQIQLSFGDALGFDKPIFLYGELGSGKSTMVANYILHFIDQNPVVIPIFIPSSYLLDKDFRDQESLIDLINRFINQEMFFPNAMFDLRTVFKTQKDLLFVVDGIDELPSHEAQVLLSLLKGLKDYYSLLRIIATGRPLELQGLVPPGWHTYTTLLLNDEDLRAIFMQEALVAGQTVSQAELDAADRIFLLTTKPELRAVTTTPLVACSIYKDLVPAISSKTLGDILYTVLHRRLEWYKQDGKEADFDAFLKAFPNPLYRERILGQLAMKIYQTPSKSLTEAQLLTLIESQVSDSPDKARICDQGVKYYQQAFLQKTTDLHYGFISLPLLECAVGIQIATDLVNNTSTPDVFTHWRPLSFAMTIIRSGGRVGEIKGVVENMLRERLTWPNHNISQSAIILSELKDETSAVIFIDILRTLQFRPIRTMGFKDQLTCYSLASCLSLAGESGFNWFWMEYCDCKNPLIHHEAELVTDILGYYFTIYNFNLPPNQVQRINNIIRPNITLQTNLCYYVLPILSLVTDTDFTVPERCRLLADLLRDDIFSIAAETKLKNLAASELEEVLNALEIVCQKTSYSQLIQAPILWLELNKTRPLSFAVLHNCLSAMTKTNIKNLYERLLQLVGADHLKAYLKFCVLTGKTTLAGDAALLLLWLGETDGSLLNSALCTSVDWLSHRHDDVKEIATFIQTQGPDEAAGIAAAMPVDNHLGVQPSYWYIFLEILLHTDLLYLEEFGRLIDNTAIHILTRYPDIRMKLNRLLIIKPAYNDYLHRASMGLSKSLAHNANAILVTCFPDREPKALIALTKGIFKHSSEKEEWHPFLYGLNFSLHVLQSLHDNLANLIPEARTFALALLYHQKFSLSPGQNDEMIKGLLGVGYFFDLLLFKQNTPSRILSKPEFFEKIALYLNNTDKQIGNRAASVLLDYHEVRLNTQQKAIALILQMEGFESYFFRLSLERSDLREMPDLKNEILAFASTRPHPTLLSLYLTTGADSVGWKAFIVHGIAYSEKSVSDHLYELYYWFLSYFRKHPAIKPVIAQVIRELLQVPVYQETQYNNNTYLFLLMLANELGIDNKSTIVINIQSPRSRVDEELMCALFLRTQLTPLGSYTTSLRSHITLFTSYKPDFINAVQQSEIDLHLVQSVHFSSEILPISGRLLLNGQLDIAALENMAKKGKQGAFISALVTHSRGEGVPIERVFNLQQIGSLRETYHTENAPYRAIVDRMTQNLLKDPENKKQYLVAIRAALDQEKDFEFMHLLFELLVAGELPSSTNIEQLLAVLLDIPSSLNQHLAFELSHFFADRVPVDIKSAITNNINNTLGALNRHYEQRYEANYNLVHMLLALASIHLCGSVSEDARRSFLFGLQGVFVDRNDMQLMFAGGKERIIFNGSALLNAVGPLYAKIPSETIENILQSGLTANVPEIQAVCRLLYYLSGKANITNTDKTKEAVIK